MFPKEVTIRRVELSYEAVAQANPTQIANKSSESSHSCSALLQIIRGVFLKSDCADRLRNCLQWIVTSIEAMCGLHLEDACCFTEEFTTTEALIHEH